MSYSGGAGWIQEQSAKTLECPQSCILSEPVFLSGLLPDHIYRLRVSMKNSAGSTTTEYDVRTSDTNHTPFVYHKTPSLMDVPELISSVNNSNSNFFFNNHLGIDFINSDPNSGQFILTIMLISTILLGAVACIIIIYRVMQKKILIRTSNIMMSAHSGDGNLNLDGNHHYLNGYHNHQSLNGKNMIPFIQNTGHNEPNNGGNMTVAWNGQNSELTVLRSSAATLDRRFFSKKMMRNSASDSAFHSSSALNSFNQNQQPNNDHMNDPNLVSSDHSSSKNCHNIITGGNNSHHDYHQPVGRCMPNESSDLNNFRRQQHQIQTSDSINPYSHPQLQFLTIARRNNTANMSSCPKSLLQTNDEYSVVQRKIPSSSSSSSDHHKSNMTPASSHIMNYAGPQCLETSIDSFIESTSHSSSSVSPARYSTPKTSQHLMTTSGSAFETISGGMTSSMTVGHKESLDDRQKYKIAYDSEIKGDEESSTDCTEIKKLALDHEKPSPSRFRIGSSFFTDSDDYCEVRDRSVWRPPPPPPPIPSNSFKNSNLDV